MNKGNLNRRRVMIKTLLISFMALAILGCGSSTSTSGVDSPSLTESQSDLIFARELKEGRGLTSTDSPPQQQTALTKCKVRYTYIYSTKTYVTLRGCAFSWIRLTGAWKTTGASIATVAKSRNLTVWISYSGSKIVYVAI